MAQLCGACEHNTVAARTYHGPKDEGSKDEGGGRDSGREEPDRLRSPVRPTQKGGLRRAQQRRDGGHDEAKGETTWAFIVNLRGIVRSQALAV